MTMSSSFLPSDLVIFSGDVAMCHLTLCFEWRKVHSRSNTWHFIPLQLDCLTYIHKVGNTSPDRLYLQYIVPLLLPPRPEP